MTSQTTGILLGGLAPALLFGITGLLQKAGTRAGIGTGWYLVLIGAGVAFTGLVFHFALPGRDLNPRSGMFATGVGLSWGIGMGLVAIALARYGAPLSKIAPIYNTNGLIVAVGALVLFAEWREVDPVRLMIGAVLVVAGGMLVANS